MLELKYMLIVDKICFYKYIEILAFYNLTYSTLIKHLYMDIPEKFELNKTQIFKILQEKQCFPKTMLVYHVHRIYENK